jgi:hypothetical protein
MIQKTNVAYLELHTDTSQYKNSWFCLKLYRWLLLLLSSTSFENGYPTSEELVCSSVGEKKSM